MINNAYTKSKEDILSELLSDQDKGLTREEAEERIRKYGENKLEEGKKKTILDMFIEQFKDIMIIILIIAAIISIALGEIVDGSFIIAIVILNATLGVYQENKASKAVEALKSMTSPRAKLIRDGVITSVSSQEIVPGDIVILETGDFVPGDLYLLETTNLQINESALTGESLASEKNSQAKIEVDAPLGDRLNSAYMSTLVTYGRGKGVVVGTGMNTEIGKIAKMINETEDEITPLQKNLAGFGKFIGGICIAVSIIIFVLGFLQGKEWLEIFMTSVSLAVAAIPEGLPAVVTIVLSMGMTRLANKHAIMKRLSAVETLGSTNTICSDKTGTLTQNKMTVTKVFGLDQALKVTGTGYSAKGEILNEDSSQTKMTKSQEWIFRISSLCVDAKIVNEEIYGDPTEGALLVLAQKAGYDIEEMNQKYPRLDEIPFDSERKLMSTIHEINGKRYLLTKGALDVILARSKSVQVGDQIRPINEDYKKQLLEKNVEYASHALRVLGFAYREIDENTNHDKMEKDLVVVGMVGMIDPPREEAKEAVKVAKRAGIRVVMITGDHLLTGLAIGKQLGIIEDQSGAMEGIEIDKFSEDEFVEVVENINVFARVSPEHKVKIVKAIQSKGNIVAMTGDGVNDAPALKKADIGIAMGITGTDVSKEAADMILTDDNFASIVAAVKEGRIIYSNIRKFVSFLLSCNIGEIMIIFFSMVFGWGIPLLPIQLLWINLLTDSFPAFALGMEKGNDNVMFDKPRSKDEPIVDKKMRRTLAIHSIGLTIAVLMSYKLGLEMYVGHELRETIARTFCFITIVIGEMLRAYSTRSEDATIFEMNILDNKYLNMSAIGGIALVMLAVYLPGINTIFKTVPLEMKDLFIAIAFGVIPLVISEIGKMLNKKLISKVKNI